MNISELIKLLEEAKQKHGDVEVTVNVDTFAEPFEELSIKDTEASYESITLYTY